MHPCTTCGKPIAPDAERCPHCGACTTFLPKEDLGAFSGCGGCLLLLIIFAFAGWLEERLFHGAGVILVILIVAALAFALIDHLVKAFTGRSLKERFDDARRER